MFYFLKGSWTGNKIAAKKVKNSFEIESFEEEIRLLQKIKHVLF